jgi:hypothetical protein
MAAVEAADGDPTEALALFRDLIDTLHERGISVSYSVTMASLAVILHRRGDYDTAAVIQRELLAPAYVGDIAAHRRLAHLRLMFLHQALPHPPGGVTLLARRRTIRLQLLVDP